MNDFFEKDDYQFEDVQSLIENEIEESIHLDYKESRSLDRSDSKKREISKDVASFANSDGGIIIYGIAEVNHKASSFSFINGNDYTKEWLEQIINSTIKRRIDEISIFPIRLNGKIEKSLYIVKIPKSLSAPHISSDKRFYKRFNFQSVMMEEYEIRESYGRKLHSKLIINGWLCYQIDKKNVDDLTFQCQIRVYNDGNVVESNYKLNVYFENFNKYLNISWPQNSSNYDYTIKGNGIIKISAVGSSPIYKDEDINVFRFDIKINREDFLQATDNVDVIIKLFYSDGEDEMKTTLAEMTKSYIEEFE